MQKNIIDSLTMTTWEYMVHAEDKKGNTLDLKHVGRFDTPNKASTYIRQNGGKWEFFSNFETCEANTTARERLLNTWGNKKDKRRSA